MARIRAGHGADGRTRGLYRCRIARRTEEVLEYRRPYRRRRGGHAQWLRSPDRWRTERCGCDRSADGGRMNVPSIDRYDVAIVGGGMVGSALGLALAGSRQRVLLVEAVAADSAQQPSFDDRTTALGNGARRILQTLGVWDDIEPRATPITEIHVSDAGHFGFARLRASEHEQAAFGYSISNRQIGAALWQALQRSRGIEVRSPARVAQVCLSASQATLRVQAGSGDDA